MEFQNYLNEIYQKYPTFDQFKIHVNNTLQSRPQRKADYSRLKDSHRSAGVLFALIYPEPLIDDNRYLDQIHIMFEKRSQNMKNHPGQMAFPGGTSEEIDSDIIETAYREAIEEVGLDTSDLQFIAYMDEFISSSLILVHPVLSWYPLKLDKTDEELRNWLLETYDPKSEESDATAFIPLSHFLNPEYYSSSPWKPNGKIEGFVRFFNINQYLSDTKVWGLTASMLRRFINEIFTDNLLPVEKMPS